MPEPEEKKSTPEAESVAVAKEVNPSLNTLELSPEAKPTGNIVSEVPSEPASLEEQSLQSASPPKIELKKHGTVGAESHGSTPSAPIRTTPIGQQIPTDSKKEIVPTLLPIAMEAEIDFVLERKRIPLTTLSTLAVGEMIELSGADFKATLFLQEKVIGEGELVLVDQKPTIQITKVFDS